MQAKNSIKYKIGMAFIILSITCPLFSFLVPLLELPTATTSTLVAFLMIGAPELLLIIGGALAGKEALESIKSKLFQPAGKIRYQIGMTIFLCGILSNWILIYLELTGIMMLGRETMLVIIASIDIGTIIGIFMMGVEFFEKCKRLFCWEGMNNRK
ncbi:transporter suffix domain-containing protein [Halodesulfovibrio marinisediminis]|uniref:Uncharacterized protein n=1 Tax=Halodesulfovibrio marinisediminis DSM 17456 TaxID=1121457 RepID=A0A1N6I828_9BACT|nr:transporter suffix domain-containing protein [Halodesulfovibrio marinisediminis]SIO28163.1 hypothetical protein SAMN02745161_2502 [Halodesulfovibrio marinisediminis DSM 17456]